MGEKISNWVEGIRLPFFTATIVPILLGSVIAGVRRGTFHWGFFSLTLLGGGLIHAGANVANDYFDHLSGADPKNYQYVRPYTGGSRVIQKGLLKPPEMLRGALIFLALGSLLGLYLTYKRGPIVLFLGLFGIFSAYFYTAPPFRLVSTGTGEIFVGLNFGILETLGAYYIQHGKLAWEPLVASLPIALLIAAVLYINEFQDAPADQEAGKLHLVVRLGRKNAVRGYMFLILAAYVSILFSAITGLISPFTLIALITIPISWKAVRTAREHYDEYLKLAPANAATVMTHLLTGILMTVGYLMELVI